ncbi:MAG: DUF5695 domain-containing protein, partial [Clostridia bacterium]|nr:DUF5695 domain-containing protein [Clostridia bacterium]
AWEIETPEDWVNDPFNTGDASYDGFYTKCIEVYGIPICSTDDVPDEALIKAADVIEMLLGKIVREFPEIMNKMVENGVSIIIIGEHETNAEHPSWNGWEDETERRGGGGVVTTVLVEDLIVPEEDTWRKTFAGLVHEATHTILTYGIGDAQGIGARSDYYERILAAYENAVAKGMYPSPNEYDASNYHEYFAGEVGRFFNGSPTDLPVEGAESLTDREQLEIYDPEIYEIIEELFDKCDLPYPWGNGTGIEEDDSIVIENDDLRLEVGDLGEITSLKIKSEENEDFKNTEYVLNAKNASAQGMDDEQHWMGEVVISSVRGSEVNELYTSECERVIEQDGNTVSVTYNEGGLTVTERYIAEKSSIRWEIEVENSGEGDVTIRDLGLPMAFNQCWTASYSGEELYDTRCVYHSFVGEDSSYIYATRPSGQGKMLLFAPCAETGSGFEYRDHWRVNNGHEGSAWAQDQSGYSSGLDVFYIHSDAIQSTGSSYLTSTSLKLKEGESKLYAFEFTAVEDEEDLRSTLYEKGLVDAQAVPSMAVALDMPTAFYLHANEDVEITGVEVKCVHETGLYSSQENMVNNNLECEGKGEVSFREKVVYNGENYYVYDLRMKCLGVNHVYVNYTYKGEERETVLQFYAMESIGDALERRSAFLVEHQTDTLGEVGDKTFDDWMMDEKANRADTVDGYWEMSYWGYGDDWGLTHGTFLAKKNVYAPVKEEIEAVDEYLDVAIWNTLMREHQEDYLIHDFLSEEPNLSPTYRGYAYPHIYNTYFAMYEISRLYPDMIEYKETSGEYLLRAHNILMALYSDSVAYNWATGLMGEISTPEIIEALENEGFSEEAENVKEIMAAKYDNFKNTKYPYGSEYLYDNTGEEAVYTLAKMNGNEEMMYKIDLKTRACRGVQPVWYFYANPVTICGENWWNFQYTASLAGYCMDDYLRNVSDASGEEKAIAERVNYAAKLANFTCINSGQIDADEENIGTVSWTYQSELGNSGGQGTGGGKLHNGWRQMSGEADLGLYGAMCIASSDVAIDPVFGLVGYGCEVEDLGKSYAIVPKDGVFTRLNLINEGLSIELYGATYSEAETAKNKSEIKMTLETEADFVKVTVSGLDADEKYALYEDGRIKATATGETAVFTYKPTKDTATVVIAKAPHAVDIEPYKPAAIEVNETERGVLSGAVEGFDGENAWIVGGEAEGGYFTYDGTVKSYVRLSNALTNGVEDFTLKFEIELEGEQKEDVRLFEFSDMNERSLSAQLAAEREVIVKIDGTEYESGICLPENFAGEIAMVQKGGNMTLYCASEKIIELETDFKLSEMGEVQRNYIGRGSDESFGAICGTVGGFYFNIEAEEIETRESDAYAVSVEEVVADAEHSLPDVVKVTYSDGFVRMAEVTWGEESDGVVKGYVGGLEFSAKMRSVEIGENVASSATVDASYCASWESVDALNDGVYTLETSAPSSDEMLRFGTWTRDSDEEWISYTWDEEKTICAIGLVFFDDGGGTRAPKSYKVQYLNEAGEWEDVTLPLGTESVLNKMNVTTFEAVTTRAIRVVMDKGEYAGVGVLEWEVYLTQ